MGHSSTNRPGVTDERAGAVTAYIALGSNLGDRVAHLDAAVRAIDASPGVHVLRVSGCIETAAWVPAAALPATDAARQGDYLNAVVRVQTSLTARALLERLLEIERGRGRDRAREGRWGARTLDLDLLLYGEAQIDEPGLRVPHPRLGERVFVLRPLSELAPDLIVPGLKRSVGELLAATMAGGASGARA